MGSENFRLKLKLESLNPFHQFWVFYLIVLILVTYMYFDSDQGQDGLLGFTWSLHQVETLMI